FFDHIFNYLLFCVVMVTLFVLLYNYRHKAKAVVICALHLRATAASAAKAANATRTRGNQKSIRAVMQFKLENASLYNAGIKRCAHTKCTNESNWVCCFAL